MTAVRQNSYFCAWEYFALALGKRDRDVGIMSAPDDERREVERAERGRHLVRSVIGSARVAIKPQHSAPSPAIKGLKDVVKVIRWQPSRISMSQQEAHPRFGCRSHKQFA